ncbi:MAG TPA: ATP-binding protein [Pirellulaceae bacterium]|nr:ATP-binding protein [Pirellulaceae bacterium]
MIQGRDQGKRFDLVDALLSVGRDATNGIQIHDTEVSRRHAELRRETDTNQFFLTDLGSSNGTFVNSDRVQRHVLKSGDRVQFGRTLLLFTDDQATGGSNVMDAVDIVSQHFNAGSYDRDAGSRIIRSVTQAEGSQILGPNVDGESPWLARARSNLQIMYRTALAVSHTLDIEQLLDRIMELIFEWVEADRGCVMIVDRETEELTPTVRRNRKGLRDNDEKMLISRTILDYVMQNKEGVLTSDATDDQRFDPSGSIVKMGVREAICVPMQGRYGIVGVIYIDTYTPPGKLLTKRQATKFTEEHLKLMVAIGHQAALAVEDTSYYSAMVQAERLAAMGQTIATLSHHIKNILQGIRGGSYLIDEGLKASDFNVVRKGWSIVDKNQEKISNLVMDMLTFSKERQPDMVPAQLNETVGDVVELMQTRARDAGVALNYEPQADIPELMLDSDALHRAILNVVTNAIDACERRDGAKVIVSTSYMPAPHQVQIVVADNGDGIAAEDLKKIFNVFESRKGARGTGLGLPVSQKILREHGGEIRVDSVPGVGSKFILELPAIIPDGTFGTGLLFPPE